MPFASSGLQKDNPFLLLGFTSTAFAWSAGLYQRVGVFPSGPASSMQIQKHLPFPESPLFTALLKGSSLSSQPLNLYRKSMAGLGEQNLLLSVILNYLSYLSSLLGELSTEKEIWT